MSSIRRFLTNCRALWHLVRVAFLAIVLCACAAPSQSGKITFEGGNITAPGYVLTQEKGGDSSVVTGHLLHPGKNLMINFSLFFPEYIFADPSFLKESNYEIIWSKISGTGSSRKITSLAIDRTLKEHKLYISFPNGGPANFIAKVNSEAEITDVKKIVATFEPKYSRRGK